MADFNFITPRLATGGGITTKDDVEALLRAGITHVIDCRSEFNDVDLFAGTSITYKWNGVADDGKTKPKEWFQLSLAFGLPMFWQPRTKLLCHCAQGINRGPSTAFAVMLALGFGKMEARAKINVARPLTIPGLAYARDAEAALHELGFLP